MELPRFLGHTLMTRDPFASQRFYQALFGWRVDQVDLATLRIRRGGELLGDIALDRSCFDAGRWVARIYVEDVDWLAERTLYLGGRVVLPPADEAGYGRLAVVEDPSGAAFLAAAPLMSEPEPPYPPPRGSVCWNELITADPAGASAFYGDVLSWSTDQVERGTPGPYWVFKRAVRDIAGMVQHPAFRARSFWLPYVAVADVDAVARAATRLGARAEVAPSAIPNVGRYAVLTDPHGARFGLFQWDLVWPFF